MADVSHCASIQQIRLDEWRNKIRRQAPMERERWLASAEGSATLGKANCNKLLKEIRRQHKRLSRVVPSAAWLDAWEEQCCALPWSDPLHQGAGHRWRGTWRPGACYQPNDAVSLRDVNYVAQVSSRAIVPGPWTDAWKRTHARQHSARMIMSRAATRYGDDAPHRRWTPAQAVESEDALDCMTWFEAEFYRHPPSPSAIAIRVVIALGKPEAEILAGKGQLPGWIR